MRFSVIPWRVCCRHRGTFRLSHVSEWIGIAAFALAAAAAAAQAPTPSEALRDRVEQIHDAPKTLVAGERLLEPDAVAHFFEARAFMPAWPSPGAAAASPPAAIEGLKPNHFIYTGLKQALARYRGYEARGGWPAIPLKGPSIKPGASDARMPIIRQRLVATGDLDAKTPDTGEAY